MQKAAKVEAKRGPPPHISQTFHCSCTILLLQFFLILQAITQIQAALRGQAARNKYIAQLDKELEFTDRDDAVVALQSAMRAHLARKKHLGYIEEDEITSRDTRTRGR